MIVIKHELYWETLQCPSVHDAEQLMRSCGEDFEDVRFHLGRYDEDGYWVIVNETGEEVGRTVMPSEVKIDLRGDYKACKCMSSYTYTIVFDPAELEVSVEASHDGSASMQRWQGLLVDIGSIPEGTASVDEYVKTLDGLRDKLLQLAGEHEVSGTYIDNMRGTLSMTGDDLVHEIQEAIEQTEAPTYVDARDWLKTDPSTIFPAGFSGTAAEFEELGEDHRSDAEHYHDRVIDEIDMRDALHDLYKEHLEEWLETAEDLEEDDLGSGEWLGLQRKIAQAHEWLGRAAERSG